MRFLTNRVQTLLQEVGHEALLLIINIHAVVAEDLEEEDSEDLEAEDSEHLDLEAEDLEDP